jgi:hypothetical protein
MASKVYRFFKMYEFNDDQTLKGTILSDLEMDNDTFEKLLKQKIDELKKIFENENIENLQSLKFDILEEKLDDGEEIVDTRGTGSGMAEE